MGGPRSVGPRNTHLEPALLAVPIGRLLEPLVQGPERDETEGRTNSRRVAGPPAGPHFAELVDVQQTRFPPHPAHDYASLAAAVASPAGGARLAVHRLRMRFRELYREEVSLTLPPGSNLDEEMRYLGESLARGP